MTPVERRCNVVVDKQPCTEEGVYMFTIEGCPVCFVKGLRSCRPHMACADHAALMRDDSHVVSMPGTLFDRSSTVPNRMTGRTRLGAP